MPGQQAGEHTPLGRAVSAELSAITIELTNIVGELALKERTGVRAGYAEQSVGEQGMNGGDPRESRQFSVAVREVLHLYPAQDGPAFTQVCFEVCDGGLSYGWIHVVFGGIDEAVDKVV
jgi:hypothetical protein